MDVRIYNKAEYRKDILAQSIFLQIEKYFGSKNDCICLYREPDFVVEGNVLPTFTILDKMTGVYFIRVYDYSNDILTSLDDKSWVISGRIEKNMLKLFENYCYVCKNDIMSPLNGIDEEIAFFQLAIFPNIDRSKLISCTINNKISKTTVLFSNYLANNYFEDINTSEINEINWSRLISVTQKANVLAKHEGAAFEKPAKSLHEAIGLNEQQIYSFDEVQLNASMSITNECEQIRGLAGSGKTVILAIKAAKLHRNDSEAKIAYVFFTHSLYTISTQLIRKYYNKLTGNEPNWDNLKVLHAWGGKTIGEGFLFNTCQTNGLICPTFSDVSGTTSPFSEACKRVLSKKLLPEYDYVLIDEAQDMPPEFFALVASVTKEPRKIVIAYDQLQTLNDTKMPAFTDLFGRDSTGNYYVHISEDNDHILKKSYRNHINVLLIALAFGFGIHSIDNKMVQIIRDEKDWQALGFEVDGSWTVQRKLEFLSDVSISRPEEYSPNHIDELYEKYPIFNFNTFNEINQEVNYVIGKIVELIKQENVRPHNIMVIDLYPRAREELTTIQAALYMQGIQSHIPGVMNGSNNFLVDENVILTTYRHAKGNEVPIVFIIGAHVIYSNNSDAAKRLTRNSLFISITRSKGWVFLNGLNMNGDPLRKEYEKIIRELPSLKFQFPSENDYNRMIKLDYISDAKQVEEMEKKVNSLRELLKKDKLDLMNLFLDDELKANLKKLLGE